MLPHPLILRIILLLISFIFTDLSPLSYSLPSESKITNISMYNSITTYSLILIIGDNSTSFVTSRINMHSAFSQFTGSLYNKHYSKTSHSLENTTVFYNHTLRSAEWVSDSLTAWNSPLIISDFRFFYNMTSTSYHNYEIGLAYSTKLDEHSFISQAYRSNYFDRLQIGLDFTEVYETYLYLGGFPQTFLNKWTHYQAHSIVNDKWELNGNCIFLNFESHSIRIIGRYTFAINARENRINVPMEFIKTWRDSIFANHIKNGSCIFNDFSTVKSFTCKCGEVKSFPDISFVIDDFVYCLQGTGLFINFFGSCTFQIQNYRNVDDYGVDERNLIVIGGHFLKVYPVLFDYEKGKIQFFSLKEVMKDRKMSDYWREMWWYLLMWTTIFGFAVVVTAVIRIKWHHW